MDLSTAVLSQAEPAFAIVSLLVGVLLWAAGLGILYYIVKAAVRNGIGEALANIRQFPVVIVGDTRAKPKAQPPQAVRQ